MMNIISNLEIGVPHRDQLELLVALSYYEHERNCEHSRHERLMWVKRDQNNISNLQEPSYLGKLCGAKLVERTSGETWVGGIGRLSLVYGYDIHRCWYWIFAA
jgi:hypothetical protein